MYKNLNFEYLSFTSLIGFAFKILKKNLKTISFFSFVLTFPCFAFLAFHQEQLIFNFLYVALIEILFFAIAIICRDYFYDNKPKIKPTIKQLKDFAPRIFTFLIASVAIYAAVIFVCSIGLYIFTLIAPQLSPFYSFVYYVIIIFVTFVYLLPSAFFIVHDNVNSLTALSNNFTFVNKTFFNVIFFYLIKLILAVCGLVAIYIIAITSIYISLNLPPIVLVFYFMLCTIVLTYLSGLLLCFIMSMSYTFYFNRIEVRKTEGE